VAVRQTNALWVTDLFLFGLGPTIITFLVGRMVARKSQGRELPAFFVLSLVWALFWKSGVMNHTAHMLAAWLALCPRPVFAFAGAISFRRGTRLHTLA
jgi:hypothetical protein